MDKENKLWPPLLGIFIFIAGLTIALHTLLEQYKINMIVVLGANMLLFLFSALSIYFQSKNINHPNPNVVIRGIMAGTFLKFIGLAAAAVIYLVAAGSDRSINAVLVGMGLYIIYAWIEVRISLRLKPKK